MSKRKASPFARSMAVMNALEHLEPIRQAFLDGRRPSPEDYDKAFTALEGEVRQAAKQERFDHRVGELLQRLAGRPVHG